ncbi:hypothetical protein, partial [Thiolapillus sp.]|uniref:hypothetical protein n=1 Tax=Thiolapillus sp. TaxID=2017437 RepID=UPI003AF62851
AAPYLAPNDWTPRLDAYFASPLALCARRVSSAASRLLGSTAFASLSMAGSGGSSVRPWFPSVATAPCSISASRICPGHWHRACRSRS